MTLHIECPKCHTEWCQFEMQLQICQTCLFNANPVEVEDTETH